MAKNRMTVGLIGSINAGGITELQKLQFANKAVAQSLDQSGISSRTPTAEQMNRTEPTLTNQSIFNKAVEKEKKFVYFYDH